MSFFAALIALLLDQIRPASHARLAERLAQAWVRLMLHLSDTGRPEHTRWLSLAILLLPALAAWGMDLILSYLNVALGWLWTIFVLYLCMGFRQFSTGFAAVRQALEAKDIDAARSAFEAWSSHPATLLNADELAQASASYGIAQTHQQVLAPLFAFALLPSVCGPVLYRVAQLCASTGDAGLAASPAFMASSRKWLAWINYVPVRLSAAGFAIVGHFEEAAAAWRSAYASAFEQPIQWLLQVAYGALAVHSDTRAQPASHNGEAAAGASQDVFQGIAALDFRITQLGHVVGLLWRSVVMWMGLLALLQFTAIVT